MSCISTPHYCHYYYEHRFGLKTNHVGAVSPKKLFLLDCLHPSASAGSHGADRGVTEPGHGRSRCYNILFLVPQPSTTMVTARCGTARERGKQSFAETCVHEAVNNWVDAGGRVAQQMDKSDGRPGEGMFGRDVIESPPSVGTVQWHPAEKEQDNDDHQHADYSLLGLQLGLRRVAAWSFCPDCPAGCSHGGHLHRVWPLDDIAAISIIAVGGHSGGQSVLHICMGEQSKTEEYFWEFNKKVYTYIVLYCKYCIQNNN